MVYLLMVIFMAMLNNQMVHWISHLNWSSQPIIPSAWSVWGGLQWRGRTLASPFGGPWHEWHLSSNGAFRGHDHWGYGGGAIGQSSCPVRPQTPTRASWIPPARLNLGIAQLFILKTRSNQATPFLLASEMWLQTYDCSSLAPELFWGKTGYNHSS
jgi:hypothetical protein